jgi:hypothetical protein
VRLRTLPLPLRSGEPDALHGKLLLLDEAVASEAHGSARLILLAHEPAAAERVLRGFDLLSFTGKVRACEHAHFGGWRTWARELWCDDT